MRPVTPANARAVLRAAEGLARFQLRTAAPSPMVAPFVQNYWIVSWDLRGQEPHRQAVLPYPAVNISFKPGRSRVAGVIRGHFCEQLDGVGRVVGTRFRPGGFRPFLGAPVSTITDRFLSIEDVFGSAGAALERTVLGAAEDAATRAVDEFLATRIPADATTVEEVARIVEQVAADPAITRVQTLAQRRGVSARSLQRLFADYVGVGPKWVIRRFRLHEAAVRIARDDAPDWARLADDLGYSDQAHFVRDFTAAVGSTPAQYARDCAAARAEPPFP